MPLFACVCPCLYQLKSVYTSSIHILYFVLPLLQIRVYSLENCNYLKCMLMSWTAKCNTLFKIVVFCLLSSRHFFWRQIWYTSHESQPFSNREGELDPIMNTSVEIRHVRFDRVRTCVEFLPKTNALPEIAHCIEWYFLNTYMCISSSYVTGNPHKLIFSNPPIKPSLT